MGNKQQKTIKNKEDVNDLLKKQKTNKLYNDYNENILWLDKNVNNLENSFYQSLIMEKNTFKLSTFTEIKDCISKLKQIKFEKTYILLSGSISKDFFIEFEKIIGEIKINPIIIIFTSEEKLNLIKKNILSLDKFTLFDINLVFDNYNKIVNQIESQNSYKLNYIEPLPYEEDENCFSFEYINELKDLIFPLSFIEFMENPNKNEIKKFNYFLLNKYSEKIKMKILIEQLLVNVKIPIQILVKFWLRAYTLESNFYREMNYSLERKLGNDFDIYIKALYQGLLTKSITPLIEQKLYRGAKINKKELDFIKNSLANKKENLPGCICYNKAFLSSSLDKNIALGFLLKRTINENEEYVLYSFQKGEQLDKENATNADIQEFSIYNEKEILFFPFSCFEIIGVETEKILGIQYFCIKLSYIGKYKSKINKSEKMPETKNAKSILSSSILEKIEMNKESNKNKFDFNIEKYISLDQKKSYITAKYDITQDYLNKNIQILNFGDNNKDEIEKKCCIYLDKQEIAFSFEYTFDKPGEYIFNFEFIDLLIDANKLFYKCTNLISINFEKFKTNYIKDMSDMFNGCSKLEILDLSNFKTHEVKNMKNMFKDCSSLKNINLSSFDTNNVLDMTEMFSECVSLNFLNLSNFKTLNVKSMYRMFYNCKSLFFINLSGFTSDNIKNISEMFGECTSLNSLDLSNFEITNNINCEKMFKNCSYFTELKNDFISEISDSDLKYSIMKTSKEFLSNESFIIKKDIKYLSKNKKYKNIEILNQSIEDFINKINQINVIVLGDTNEGTNEFLKVFNDVNSCNILTFSIGEINVNNSDAIFDIVEATIIGSSIDFIWLCISGTKIDDYLKDFLDKLIYKYENNISIFIIYLKKEENDDFKILNENLGELYGDKKLELIPFILKDRKLDELIIKTKNNFKNLLYSNIHNNMNNNIMKLVKDKIEKIEQEKNLSDLPSSVSNYFEKLLGKITEINNYLNKASKNMINYSKMAIDIDSITKYIEIFKKEKLKLKITGNKNKNLNIENFDDDLNKELKKIYSKISENFYQEEFKEEIFNFFIDLIKQVAEVIILESLKDLKFEELKPLIDKNLKI